jgi:hypothetical protein
MPDLETIATFVAGSTLGGFAGYFIRIFIEHNLAKSLSAADRKFAAAKEFRTKVNEAISLFQKPHENWSANNKMGHAMRSFVSLIDLAAKDFSEFFTGSDKVHFESKWQETKDYCSKTLPMALQGRNEISPNEAKATFLKHIDELLSYAKST